MPKLIHPVTGLKRYWPDAPGMQAARADRASDIISFPVPQQQTAARIDQHQLGMLFTPVSPDRAKYILQNALSGELYFQWELFSLMEDSWDRLSKNLNEVKNAVKRLNWSVTPYCERGQEPTPSAQEKADLVQCAMKNWQPEPGTLEYSFEDAIYHGMDAMGKGISVQEIQWQVRDGAILPRAGHLLTPRNYGWNPEGTHLGIVAEGDRNFRQQTGPWTPFAQNQFMVGQWHARSGAPGMTALLRPLVPYWIGMTFGWRWLMQTAQLFGVPFRWATYDANEPGLLNKISDMLENMGAAGWAAFPAGTVLEFKEAVTSATDNPQAVIIELAKKACDLLILGQELSSESEPSGLGSGNAALQGKVRQDVLHSAAYWAGDLLNYQFVPALLNLNYGETSEAPCLVPDLSIDPDPKSLADRDQVLIGMGLRLPTRWMYERHNVPEPEADEPTLERQPMMTPDLPPNMQARAVQAGASRTGRDATDQLINTTLENLTGVSARWLAGVKPFFRKLIQAARDERVTDAELVQTLEAAQKQFPELFNKLNKEALAEALEASMGAACVNGAVKGFLARSSAGRAKRRDEPQ
jgi:phage gp29-like protein